MHRFLLVTVALLAAMAGPAMAQIQPPGGAPGFQSPVAPPSPSPVLAPSSVTTSRGAGLVTGSAGAPQTIMIPGSPIPGTVFNNGNGTSSIMIPGSASELVPTPR
jgi:hypothetical protein